MCIRDSSLQRLTWGGSARSGFWSWRGSRFRYSQVSKRSPYGRHYGHPAWIRKLETFEGNKLPLTYYGPNLRSPLLVLTAQFYCCDNRHQYTFRRLFAFLTWVDYGGESFFLSSFIRTMLQFRCHKWDVLVFPNSYFPCLVNNWNL